MRTDAIIKLERSQGEAQEKYMQRIENSSSGVTSSDIKLTLDNLALKVRHTRYFAILTL